MNVVFVNHTIETFTPTRSGAIATHVCECYRAARRQGAEPVVISGRCDAEPFPNVNAIWLDYPHVPERGAVYKFHRAVRKLSGWRHLRTEARAGHTMKQPAPVGVAGTDVRLRAAAHGVSAAIEAEAVELLIRSVATDAVTPEKRLNVALEVDGRWHLRDGGQGQHRQDERDQRQSHAPILPFRKIMSLFSIPIIATKTRS